MPPDDGRLASPCAEQFQGSSWPKTTGDCSGLSTGRFGIPGFTARARGLAGMTRSLFPCGLTRAPALGRVRARGVRGEYPAITASSLLQPSGWGIPPCFSRRVCWVPERHFPFGTWKPCCGVNGFRPFCEASSGVGGVRHSDPFIISEAGSECLTFGAKDLTGCIVWQP